MDNIFLKHQEGSFSDSKKEKEPQEMEFWLEVGKALQSVIPTGSMAVNPSNYKNAAITLSGIKVGFLEFQGEDEDPYIFFNISLIPSVVTRIVVAITEVTPVNFGSSYFPDVNNNVLYEEEARKEYISYVYDVKKQEMAEEKLKVEDLYPGHSKNN